MKMLTTKQAADFLGVSIRTLKYWRKTGKLQPTMTGAKGAKFYSEVQLLEVQKILTGAKYFTDKVQECKKSGVQDLNFARVQENNDKNFAPLKKSCTPNLSPLIVKGFVKGDSATPSTYDTVQPVTQNNENVIGFKYEPPPQTGDNQTGETKKATDNPSVAKNIDNSNTNDNTENKKLPENEPKNFKVDGLLDNLPTAIKSLQRYLPTRDDGKTPRGKEWQKSENHKFLSDVATKHAALFLKGNPNFLALDFDHVLNADGTFVNAAAQDFYKYSKSKSFITSTKLSRLPATCLTARQMLRYLQAKLSTILFLNCCRKLHGRMEKNSSLIIILSPTPTNTKRQEP